MEIHPTWVIMIGLGFDIAGAILIIRPLLDFIAFKKITMPKAENYSVWKTNIWNKPIGELNKELAEKDYNRLKYRKRDAIFIWLGFCFLIFGFTLQIIGNYYQNPPA